MKVEIGAEAIRRKGIYKRNTRCSVQDNRATHCLTFPPPGCGKISGVVAGVLVAREGWYHALIKKKIKFFSYISKFRRDRLQSHMYMTNRLLICGFMHRRRILCNLHFPLYF